MTGMSEPANPTAIRSVTADCGGCDGLGSHRSDCLRNPNYSYRLVLAKEAASLGDRIGSNDPGLANMAYALQGALENGDTWNHPDCCYDDGRRDGLSEAATALDKSDLYDVSAVVNWLRLRAAEGGNKP